MIENFDFCLQCWQVQHQGAQTIKWGSLTLPFLCTWQKVEKPSAPPQISPRSNLQLVMIALTSALTNLGCSQFF